MDTTNSPLRTLAMRFAEIVDEVGRRLRIGCVMAAGQDWVEVSLQIDCAGGGAPEDRLAGLQDPRPAALNIHR